MIILSYLAQTAMISRCCLVRFVLFFGSGSGSGSGSGGVRVRVQGKTDGGGKWWVHPPLRKCCFKLRTVVKSSNYSKYLP